MSQPPTKPGGSASGPRNRSGSMVTTDSKPVSKAIATAFAQPLGYDPGRLVPVRPAYQAKDHPSDNKNLDLPPEAYLRVSMTRAHPSLRPS